MPAVYVHNGLAGTAYASQPDVASEVFAPVHTPSVSQRTVTAGGATYDAGTFFESEAQVEVFLYLWDDLDDWLAACRHVLRRLT